MEKNDATVSVSRSLSGISILIGLWMIISPYILTYATAQSKWEQTVAGIFVLILALARYSRPEIKWVSYINVLIAAWLIIAPFATSYQSLIAYWNEIISAVVLGILEIWNSGLDSQSLHHGHA